MNKYKLVYIDPKHGGNWEMQITANNYQEARKEARKEFRSENLYSLDKCKDWNLYRCNDDWTPYRTN